MTPNQANRKLKPTAHGPVAQGIEHLPSKQRVEGSNPSGTAIKSMAYNSKGSKESYRVTHGVTSGRPETASGRPKAFRPPVSPLDDRGEPARFPSASSLDK